MALYLVYRKVDQTPGSVEYQWGPSEDDLTKRVVLDPGDPTGWPTVGGDEATMPAVVRAVIRRRRMTGSWPEKGVVEH